MTKRECTIVTAYTGTAMLQGDDLKLFYEYAEEKLGYPVMTHDMASAEFWEKLKHEAKNDFLNLCMTATEKDVRENVKGEWLHKKITDDYHVTGQCSNCHERRRIDNFCPNCGADMRGK